MKNYFKNEEGYILPFENIIIIQNKKNYVHAWIGEDNVLANWYSFPIEQYEDYVKWLEATSPEKYEITQAIPEEKTKFIDHVLESRVEYPKKENITLTAEQVTKLMKKFNIPKCNNCKNSKKITDACINCDEKNSELIPTDDFVKEVNEVIND